MSHPTYRDQHELADLGTAGFLVYQTDADRREYAAALLQINARGEPVEFTHRCQKISATGRLLTNEAFRSIGQELTRSLLEACSTFPAILLVNVEDASCVELSNLHIPLHFVSLQMEVAGDASAYAQVVGKALAPRQPVENLHALQLIDLLTKRNLLREPFNRALERLRSIYCLETSTNGNVQGSMFIGEARSETSTYLSEQLQMSDEFLLSSRSPLEWVKPLLPYQVDGIRLLLQQPSLMLADDMGLGKTIQTLAALRVLVAQSRIQSALIIAPASLLSQWRSEARLWAPELRVSTIQGLPKDRDWQWRTPAHIYLISYETFRSDFSTNPKSPVARLWDVVVLDEAQKIKNANTTTSQVCKRLHRSRQWALTGTPLENSVDDLKSILEFVVPDSPLRSSFFPSSSDLRFELSQVQLRRKKSDVLLDLPPKLVSRVALPLTKRQRETYDRAEEDGIVELRRFGESIPIQSVLELIMRLKQICNFCPASGESSKLNDVQERMDTLTAQGHKALVFTQFTSDQNGARAIARELGSAALTYTGDMNQSERDDVLKRFREDERFSALILSLRAGGQGLNLQQASYVFHFDRWWNPAVEGQAEARAHRMGQEYPVNVYAYVCENTIEERIEQILEKKKQLFEELVDDVSIDLSTAFTRSELLGLFSLGDQAQ